ncbi:MAG TPA: hypothetical protein VGL87_14595 [Steroidobacteraceae bacterium]|jgi:hypothetical protein
MKIQRAAVAASALLGTLYFSSSTIDAQTAEPKEKAPMYTYFSSWDIPRAKWADMEKTRTGNGVFARAFSSGTLVGYGSDETVVHTAEGYTHDGWFQSMSMAGLLTTLSDLMQGGNTTTAVFASATKHEDQMLSSRYYEWKSGSWKGAYTHTAVYKLKDSAPDDAIDMLAKSFVVPLMEKLLADGTIVEYEIDEQAIHTNSPAVFFLVYITPTGEGQDRVNKALGESIKADPLAGPAFNSMVDFSVHRDLLVRGDVTYK